MKRLSRKDIELISLKIINEYKMLPEIIGRNLYRIDPVLLCEKVLNLNVDYMHLSLDGSVLGLTSFTELGVEVFENDDEETFYFLDGRTVLIESGLKKDIAMKGRYNFTVAHEASHQIFKKLFPKEYGVVDNVSEVHFYKPENKSNRYITDWEEWQANTLAAYLLLPKELLVQAMRLFDFLPHIKVINKMINYDIYQRFVAMADFLGCSKTALSIRLKQIGVLEKEYNYIPFSSIDVEVD